MIAISVIIPTYNRAQLTKNAVMSVLGQSYDDFEVIVIDDGSTDDTESVITSIPDERVVYLKQENGGAASASNRGIAQARGRWIAFLDSDDQFLPPKFHLQMEAVEGDDEAGVIYGRYYGTSTIRQKEILVGRCFDKRPLADLIMGPIFHWSTCMMRTDLVRQVGAFDTQFWVGEDWELTLRMAMTNCTFVCVPEPLATIEIQEVSLSRDIHKYESNGRKGLDKTFANPHFPAELEHLKPLAYASHLIRAAASAYISPEPELGRAPLEKALAVAPSMLQEDKEFLITKLFSYIQGVSLEDPSVTLNKMSHHLPADPQVSASIMRELWGRYYLNSAFHAADKQEGGSCRRNVVKALVANPANFTNRGLYAIFVQSIMGNGRFAQVAHKEA